MQPADNNSVTAMVAGDIRGIRYLGDVAISWPLPQSNFLSYPNHLISSHIHLAKAKNTFEIMGKEAWRKRINIAIETNNFNFVSWTAVDEKRRKIAHNVTSYHLKKEVPTGQAIIT